MKAKSNAEREWLRKQARLKVAEQEKQKAPERTEAKAETKKAEKKHGNGFDDVAGMEELKQLVREGFINVLNNQECAKAFGIRPPSLLFYGPAGCGKTFFAEKIAEEVGISFMKVVPDDIASSYVHGTQRLIGEVFSKAECKAPTLIFFDEFDAMVPCRSSSDKNYQNGEVNEFLCMLNNAAEKGIYVLAATNHPEMIDSPCSGQDVSTSSSTWTCPTRRHAKASSAWNCRSCRRQTTSTSGILPN